MRIAVIGATGLVGRELLGLLNAAAECQELGLFASQRSVGVRLACYGSEHDVAALDDCNFAAYDLAFFSVGDDLSREYVPRALAAGCTVIDKSNAYRLEAGVPLVVAGVNDGALAPDTQLVANPNCSTIIAVHALAPLHRKFCLKHVFAATYQSVSGAGRAAGAQLASEMAGLQADDLPRPWQQCDPGQYAGNVIPGVGGARPGGYRSEETKLRQETRKILDAPGLPVVAHAVRVPVFVGHSIAITVELDQAARQVEVEDAWNSTPDTRYLADQLPVPLSATRHDQVEVGRLRAEDESGCLWSFFVSGDNLRLGAALNGWRVMQLLRSRGILSRKQEERNG